MIAKSDERRTLKRAADDTTNGDGSEAPTPKRKIWSIAEALAGTPSASAMAVAAAEKLKRSPASTPLPSASANGAVKDEQSAAAAAAAAAAAMSQQFAAALGAQSPFAATPPQWGPQQMLAMLSVMQQSAASGAFNAAAMSNGFMHAAAQQFANLARPGGLPQPQLHMPSAAPTTSSPVAYASLPQSPIAAPSAAVSIKTERRASGSHAASPSPNTSSASTTASVERSGGTALVDAAAAADEDRQSPLGR